MASKRERDLTEARKGVEYTSAITMVFFEIGERYVYTLPVPEIVYIPEGVGIATLDDGSVIEMNKENLYLIAAGKILLCVREDMRAILCRVTAKPDGIFPKNFECRQDDIAAPYAAIENNVLFEHFYSGVCLYIKNGFADEELLRAKTEELHQLITHSTGKREYLRFFAPLLNKDYLFNIFVRQHAATVPRVAVLAEMSHVSPRVLNNRFRENFGISPKEFLCRERIKCIEQNLHDSSRTLKDIAYAYGISVQYLTYLCKKEFEMTPTQIRGGKSGSR